MRCRSACTFQLLLLLCASTLGCAEAQQLAAQMALAAAQTAATANLVANGGFEQPVVPAGRYQLFHTGQAFPGWQVVGARGNVAPISGSYRSGSIAFNAHTGNQWLDLTGLSNSESGVQQTVRTQPGTRYELAFFVGNVNGGGFGTTSAVEVLVDGVSVGVFRNDAGSAGTQTWRRASVSITAASTQTTLTFLNRDASNDNSNGLDDVSLVALTAPQGGQS